MDWNIFILERSFIEQLSVIIKSLNHYLPGKQVFCHDLCGAGGTKSVFNSLEGSGSKFFVPNTPEAYTMEFLAELLSK